MQKKLIAMLSFIILACTVMLIPSEAHAITFKKVPDFYLATPEPTTAPVYKIPSDSVVHTFPTPTPEYKIPADSKVYEFSTPTPTPEYKIPADSKVHEFPSPTATSEATTKPGKPLDAYFPDLAETPKGTVPVITKHPGGETIDAGQNCSFVAYAENYTRVSWYFHKGDSTVNAEDAAGYFAGLRIENIDECKVRLYSVPASMNGWEIGATFTNAIGSVDTNRCTITVNGGSTPTPAPTQTPAPTAAPTEAPAPTAEAAAATAAPAAETAAPAEVSAAPEATTAPAEKPETEKGGHTLLFVLGGIVIGAACAGAAFVLINKKNSGNHYKGRH